MLSLLSRIKSYIWRKHLYPRYVEDMNALLKYPHDNDRVDAYIDSLPEEVRSYYRGDREVTLGLTSLKLKYKFLNSKNLFFRSLDLYNRILQREASLTTVVRLAGFRKMLWARFILGSNQDNYNFKLFRYSSKFFPGYDRDFESRVSGKVVAVVGGAPSDYRNGRAIDGCDLVARINMNSVERFDPEILGERVDLVYVRGERGEAIKNNDIDYFRDVENSEIFYRVKASEHLNCFPRDAHASLCLNFDQIFDYGHLNAVQTAVLDLIVHGASLVKVFNVDFNMSGQSFRGYRPKNLADIDYSKIFVIHPPHPQFHICKALNGIGLVDGDEVFMSLINMELSEFSDECQKIWAG